MPATDNSIHKAAEVLPLLPELELRQLADDIGERGLIHPILLYRGQVLDGRNRLRACQLAGIEPRFESVDEQLDLKGITPLEFVASLNLRRRQLSASQTAMAAAAAIPEWVAEGKRIGRSNLKKGDRKIPQAGIRGRSDKAMARLFGISATYVTDALMLRRYYPDLAKAVSEGECKLSRAVRISRERKLLARREAERKVLKRPRSKMEVAEADISVLAQGWKHRKVDLIVTDPPYSAANLPLWQSLGTLAAGALRPGGYLAVLSGLQYLPTAMSALSESGLCYYWTICVRLIGPNGRRHGFGLISAWRPCLIFFQPEFERPARQVLDHFSAETPVEKRHRWEQQPELFGELIRDFSRPGNWVLDPFLGSGSVLAACQTLGRNGMGFDVDPGAVVAVKKRLGMLA